ncbi:MAG: hypothetical protein KAQ98_14340 [Bacteriovoracaceae bacterium]|nr:hypothetical protein [Bacteriovoracaceae bacterium]
MRFKFLDFKLKQDFDRIKILHWGHFICIMLALLLEMYHGITGWFFGFVIMVVAGILYRLYFRTINNLYYTTWTFSFFVFVYLLVGFLGAVFGHHITVLTQIYFLAIVLLAVESYLLSSPIYFPRVSWWEYDFRYRADLKVEVNVADKVMEGRLTDLRRAAGCVVVFEEVDVGEIMNIKTIEGNIALVAEIMSKRENILGRGVVYGVKFHFQRGEERNNFLTLCKFFKEKKLFQKKIKFKKIKDVHREIN